VDTRRVITSPDAPSGTGPYSPALVVGDFVFVSGQGPLEPQTLEIRGASIEEQTRLTFKNVEAILKAAGSSLQNVVRVSVYLSDIDNYKRFNDTYCGLVETPFRVRTTVACRLQGILIEVACIATVSHAA
jgi:2-iminobutanoate/2-iminopropanoate deaminase